jgi:hypothetical protein
MPEPKVFKVAEVSASFAIRMMGKRIFDIFVDSIQDTECKAFTFDWTGVNATSPSFVDEFVGQICTYFESKRISGLVVFECENSNIAALLRTVIERHGCLDRFELKPAPLPI